MEMVDPVKGTVNEYAHDTVYMRETTSVFRVLRLYPLTLIGLDLQSQKHVEIMIPVFP